METSIFYLFTSLIQATAYYHESSFSTRDISRCKTIYMCPTFCYQLVKGCFICKCDESTTEYMIGAMTSMKDDYKPIKQTGTEYSSEQSPNGGKSKSTWSGMGRSNMFPGMGGLSGVYTFGGMNPSAKMGQSGKMNNVKMYGKSQYATSFYPSKQILPGQCPLMDYSCPSVCWYTDSSTGCISCGCDNINPTQATTTKPVQFVGTTQQPILPTTDKKRYGVTETIAKLMHSTTTVRYSACLPIEYSCPLHCLNFDHKTFCALCNCPKTTIQPSIVPIVKVTNMSQVTMRKTTNAPKSSTSRKTNALELKSALSTTTSNDMNMKTTTEPNTEKTTITTRKMEITCKPINRSCPMECRTYDLTTYCPVCLCQPTIVPVLDSCNHISTDCPRSCVKLGGNGCPVCSCSETTSDPSENTENVCLPIRMDCRHDCITYHPQTFCPVCKCNKAHMAPY